MERKKGEIFEHNGEWYQCVKSQDGSCKHCDMNFEGKCLIPIKECTESGRNDKSYVIFKKLEKVGEPYVAYGKVRQKYKLYIPLTITKGIIERDISCDDVHVIVDIENKQNKETMEDMEEKKLNLKPFDLQKAKQGKPVCTRDGRKARIICFDFQSIENTPIVATVQVTDKQEVISHYYEDGRQFVDGISELDLMMLPEKKEGWVNVYKGGLLDTKSYPTKKEAFDKACPEGYVDTVKVCWEE